ncbi:molecular chaperone DnaJ [Methylobacterium bullatum]|uniref:molecular chaperone DnaJ n=1 Tax=Methylobacterium bullatum TaxID=570505 RepID=UPI001784DB19|nr:molecular chaperone DnaJ [Methylobacterium bullatum]
MMIEFNDLDFSRYSPAQLAQVRPSLAELAVRMRRNLRLLETLLGIESERPDLAREHDRLCYDLHAANALGAALEVDLLTAQGRIKTLEERLAGHEDDEEAAIYRSVGLVPTAHGVVVSAARRALLAHFHPDRAVGCQASATQQFRRAADAFERITELRR